MFPSSLIFFLGEGEVRFSGCGQEQSCRISNYWESIQIKLGFHSLEFQYPYEVTFENEVREMRFFFVLVRDLNFWMFDVCKDLFFQYLLPCSIIIDYPPASRGEYQSLGVLFPT